MALEKSMGRRPERGLERRKKRNACLLGEEKNSKGKWNWGIPFLNIRGQSAQEKDIVCFGEGVDVDYSSTRGGFEKTMGLKEGGNGKFKEPNKGVFTGETPAAAYSKKRGGSLGGKGKSYSPECESVAWYGFHEGEIACIFEVSYTWNFGRRRIGYITRFSEKGKGNPDDLY